MVNWGCFGIFSSSIDCCKSEKPISSLGLELEEMVEDTVPEEEVLEEEKGVRKDIMKSAKIVTTIMTLMLPVLGSRDH